MTEQIHARTEACSKASQALVVFQPGPNILYDLDLTARLAGIPRRSLLVYCRAGLIQPIIQQADEAMAFTDASIYAIRRLEQLRTRHRSDLAWLMRP